jgi:hypothetical protein
MITIGHATPTATTLREKLALLEANRAYTACLAGDLLGAARLWTAARRMLARPGSPTDTLYAERAHAARCLAAG